MNTVVFLSSSGKIQQIAYDMLENLWNDKKIVCLYKHTSKKKYNRYPENYDLGISFLYNHDIPTEEINRTKWIGFSTSPLPKYGGHNCAYHAILNDSNEFGASIYYMTPQRKEVILINTMTFFVKKEYTARDLIRKSIECSFLLFIKYIPSIINEKFPEGKPERVQYYEKTPIQEEIYVNDLQKKLIRALISTTTPKIKIENTIYTITRE